MASTWTIVSQQQRRSMTPGGGFQEVMTVHFQTATGTTASVDVPLAAYNAEKVRELIDARVAQIDAVHEL